MGQEVGGEEAGAEIFVFQHLAVEGDGGFDAPDDVFLKGPVHAVEDLFPGVAPGAELDRKSVV